MSERDVDARLREAQEARERFRRDLDEATYKVSPTGLEHEAERRLASTRARVEQAIGRAPDIAENAAGRLEHYLVRTVRENATLFALLGIGVALLVATGSTGSDTGRLGRRPRALPPSRPSTPSAPSASDEATRTTEREGGPHGPRV